VLHIERQGCQTDCGWQNWRAQFAVLSEIRPSGQCIAMAFGDNFQLYDAVRDLAAG